MSREEIGNLGYIFYKKLYGGKENKLLEICTDKKVEKKLGNKGKLDKILNSKIEEIEKDLGDDKIILETTYPGLLIGSGYNHDSGLEGDFKIGFYFDYTTGQPMIPGSSVKGVLRSVFPNEEEDDDIIEGKLEYLNNILAEKYDLERLKEIELEIFEGKEKKGNIPMRKRDIFYDAFIVTKEKEILGEDFLCPHGDDPLKNPNPIKFLKILPGIKFQFNFDLKDRDQGGLKILEKKKLFEEILKDIGIGAKTNVGYGQLQ